MKTYKFWSRPIGTSEEVWTELRANNAKEVRQWAKENEIEITSKIYREH